MLNESIFAKHLFGKKFLIHCLVPLLLLVSTANAGVIRYQKKSDGVSFTLDKGLKLLNPVLRPDLPIYVAALGPKNIEMAAEIADGWLPFPYSTEHAAEVFKEPLANGATKRSAERGSFTIAPSADGAICWICVTARRSPETKATGTPNWPASAAL